MTNSTGLVITNQNSKCYSDDEKECLYWPNPNHTSTTML